MKYIIIGLGKLGKALARSFTATGHEVIGVDFEMSEVDAVKNSIATAICLDTKDENAVKTLPLKEADAVYVTYGEDFGASIYAAAVLKKLDVGRLIVRAISPLHENILTAIGVNEILLPEYDYADGYVTSLHFGSKLDHWYKVTPTHHLVKIDVPESFVGEKILDMDFSNTFNLKLVSVLRLSTQKNLLGISDQKMEDLEEIDEYTTFKREDKLVLYGRPKDYNKLKEV